MIFGVPAKFAVEVVNEPDAAFGRNVAGRFRVFLGGQSVGNFNESGCTFRQLSEELVTLASTARALWHPSLSGMTPQQQFAMLEGALFVGSVDSPPEEYHLMNFLTNVSEVFNHVMGFLLSPEDGHVVALVELLDTGTFISHRISYTDFSSVAAQFALWLKQQEEAQFGTRAA